jgi:hypothetical protein
VSPGTEVTNDGRLRLFFLLVVLVALGAYAATQRPWVVGSNGGSAVAAAPTNCPAAAAPALRTVDLQHLNRLREGITAEAVFGAELHSYEEGFVGTAAAFSDQEPTMQPISTSDEGVEAGYEIRWWTPSRHDVVADVWAFEDANSAGEFVDQATSSRCRTAARETMAPAPDGGVNLEWRNPFGFMQQDLYLQRGARVYRLSVVVPGAPDHPVIPVRREGFKLVDALGCELVGLSCGLEHAAAGEATSI